jgi:SsrA-binding protein
MSSTSANICSAVYGTSALRFTSFMRLRQLTWREFTRVPATIHGLPVTTYMSKKSPAKESATIAENRKARHEYFIEETYEAGLSLLGWEVKSLRAGRVQLKEAYVFVKDAEAFLFGAHVSALPTASTHVIPDPIRTRKLLLNRSELNGLIGAVERRGYTLVPLEMYWKNGRAKLRIGLAKGKKEHDKRATEKDRDWKREKSRLMKHSTR